MVVNGVGNFETTRKQLAITSRYCLKIAGGVLELDPVQKVQILNDAEMCPKAHPPWPSSLIVDGCSIVQL